MLQVVGGHRLDYLALCVAAENLTGAMAGTALVAYLSDLCSPAFTATQYALLSSLSAVGRTMVASSGGVLADKLGWVPFFLLTTVAHPRARAAGLGCPPSYPLAQKARLYFRLTRGRSAMAGLRSLGEPSPSNKPLGASIFRAETKAFDTLRL